MHADSSWRRRRGQILSLGPWIIALGLISLAVRLALIFLLPPPVRQNDIAIYMAAGRLVNSGINPYDHLSNLRQREAARLDSYAYRDFPNATQARWDYYVSSNLPLSTLLWAAIDKIEPGERGFQVAFALFDSLAVIAAGLFIFTLWNGPNRLKEKFILALLFMGISPFFLIWGTFVSEDKGFSTVLVVTGLLLCATHRLGLPFAGAAILGGSVSYKLFGVFFVPLGLWLAGVGVKGSSRWRLIVFIIFFLFGLGVWFLPFGPKSGELMIRRFLLTEGMQEPLHSSVWRILAVYAPGRWNFIRQVLCLLLSGWVAIKAAKGQVHVSQVFAYLAIIYAGLWLVAGSPDRFGVAVFPAILVMGFFDWRAGVRLIAAHFASGAICMGMLAILTLRREITLGWDQEMAAAVSIGFFIVYYSFEILRADNSRGGRVPIWGPAVPETK